MLDIIAFDLGANMAWAVYNEAGQIRAHMQIFSGTRVTRLAAIKDALEDFPWEDYDIVVYETPLARGQDATRSLWAIAGILEATVTQAGRPIIDIAVPTIKKFATGNGMASKLEMIKAAKKFGYRGANEHEADAVCLLNYARTNLERLT